MKEECRVHHYGKLKLVFMLNVEHDQQPSSLKNRNVVTTINFVKMDKSGTLYIYMVICPYEITVSPEKYQVHTWVSQPRQV